MSHVRESAVQMENNQPKGLDTIYSFFCGDQDWLVPGK